MEFTENNRHEGGSTSSRVQVNAVARQMPVTRAFRTRPFRRTRTEVRNSDSESETRART
jgi:hypothetical protein